MNVRTIFNVASGVAMPVAPQISRVFNPHVPIKAPFFYLMCAGILSIIAVGDFFISGLSRRTIAFYSEENGETLLQERFILRKWNREDDIRSFIEEIVLGPVDLNTAPLLDKGARLETFFYQNGAAVIGFSEEAALPPGPLNAAKRTVLGNLKSIRQDIRRNFPFIRSIRFFIDGEEIAEVNG
jgi:hypothetical protein